MGAGERSYHMKLSDFYRYLTDKGAEVQACYKEVEEVRVRLEAAFKQALAAWQEKYSYCLPRLAAQRHEMPPAFAQLLDRIEAEERARIEKEIADLEAEVRVKRAQMDELVAQAQGATDVLRRTNPRLNEEEEQLKAQVARLEDEYAELYEQIERLDTFPLGWLINAFKIAGLKRRQRAIKQEQARNLAALRRVRQEWADNLQKAGEEQAKWRADWEQLSIRASEAQARRDHLVANLNALAAQAGLQRVLDEMVEPPADVSGDLGAALKELAERNRVRKAYEEGLRAVSEASGLTKGVATGMERFRQSVGKVVAEQRRYNLKNVDVRLPQSVVALNESWNELRNQVKDDHYLGARPLEFSRIVSDVRQKRLTDANIQLLFEQMGQALNKATEQWR